jgi:hypothetical protein
MLYYSMLPLTYNVNVVRFCQVRTDEPEGKFPRYCGDF